MMSAPPCRDAARTLCKALACTLLLAACTDSPTAPESWVQQAEGRTWVAIAEPAGLPSVRTWLQFVDGHGEAAGAIRALRDEASAERRAGRIERSLELEGEASAAAAGSLARTPDARTILLSLAALESWVQRAEARRAGGEFPELDSAVVSVRALRDDARALLVEGDTGRAVQGLDAAARQARSLGPLAVAVRLVGRAEARIAADPSPSDNLVRAQRLLQTAREAMATGDQTRAMKRALYALQLVYAESRRLPAGGRRRP